jgi:2-oxoisovalerate dehydrogenase E1 component
MLPFGRARIVSAGSDLTVVTWGAMVERCELAAAELDASIEIFDLRTIAPWDSKTVLGSVRKTGKCLIVHEDILLGGFGAEVAATIAQDAFVYLDGVERIGGALSRAIQYRPDGGRRATGGRKSASEWPICWHFRDALGAGSCYH